MGGGGERKGVGRMNYLLCLREINKKHFFKKCINIVLCENIDNSGDTNRTKLGNRILFNLKTK